MKKKILHLLIATILAISVFPFVATEIDSATHTAVSDTLSRLKTTQSANHTIAFTLASAWNASETVVIDFVDGDGWDTTGFANTEAEDYDIKWGVTEKTIVASGGCAADSIEITTVNTTTDTFTFTLCAGSTASGANEVIEIEIGTNATGGDDQIENATASGSKLVTITGPTSGDSASLAIPIMSEDQITVSATVDPTITSALSGTGYPTCALGILADSAVQGCPYTNTVSTNATTGYNSTIVENGNLCSPSVAVCTNNINDVADGTVTIGAEEYGVSTSDTDAPGITADFDGTCDDGANETGSAITGTAQVYADESTPQSGDATNLCHSASITATTPAGSYSHIVTHITTGNF
ncbi:MAG: hypothetical protein A2113_04245 [Candidatus Woykebacteria bacterium GWA1_44_8]|uniref:Uncharacterized protein n=1 Tax=Candidatus Woykebacteria bacterium GWA1_44_8 TaxID=1802591 RepID=A0A1G1W4G5_9BACT|nr:MAG: hypothetical protein A2113_04245 [Candidatus Woykebacteria bacterium GWA1_44_8]